MVPPPCPPPPPQQQQQQQQSLRCLVCLQESSSSGAKIPLFDSTIINNVNSSSSLLKSPHLGLLTQMMFGAAPLISHKGRSTKLHEFRLPDTNTNAILVTSLFTINLSILDESINNISSEIISSGNTHHTSSTNNHFSHVDQLKHSARRLTRSMYAIGLVLPSQCPQFRYFILTYLSILIEKLLIRLQHCISRVVASNFISNWFTNVVKNSSQQPYTDQNRSTRVPVNRVLKYSMQMTLATAVADILNEVVSTYLALVSPNPLSGILSETLMHDHTSKAFQNGSATIEMVNPPYEPKTIFLPMPKPTPFLAYVVSVMLTFDFTWFDWACSALDMSTIIPNRGDDDLGRDGLLNRLHTLASDFRVVVVGPNSETKAWLPLLSLILAPPPPPPPPLTDPGEDTVLRGHEPEEVSPNSQIPSRESYPYFAPPSNYQLCESGNDRPSKIPPQQPTNIQPYPSKTYIPSLGIQAIESLTPTDWLRMRLEVAESRVYGSTKTASNTSGCSASTWVTTTQQCSVLVIDLHQLRLSVVTACESTKHEDSVLVWDALWPPSIPSSSNNPVSTTRFDHGGGLALSGIGISGSVETEVVHIDACESIAIPCVSRVLASVYLTASQLDSMASFFCTQHMLGDLACLVIQYSSLVGTLTIPQCIANPLLPMRRNGDDGWTTTADDDFHAMNDDDAVAISDILGCSVMDLSFIQYLATFLNLP